MFRSTLHMQYPSCAKNMHHKCFLDAIPITNHNVSSIVSLFRSRWVLHILDLFFQSRCNTHRAPKRCIINFHGMKYPSQTIMFLEIYHCLFGDGYCIFDLLFQCSMLQSIEFRNFSMNFFSSTNFTVGLHDYMYGVVE